MAVRHKPKTCSYIASDQAERKFGAGRGGGVGWVGVQYMSFYLGFGHANVIWDVIGGHLRV